MSEVRILMSDRPGRYQPRWRWERGAKAKLVRSHVSRECMFCKQSIPAREAHYAVNAFMYYRVCAACGDERRASEA